MKVRSKNLTNKQRIKTLDTLYTAAGSLRGRGVMKAFLRDLLTESERIMLGRRILIAQQLLAGSDYETIQTELGVAPNTIQRVHRWLNDSVSGYEQAVSNLENEMEARKKKYGRLEFGTFAHLKKKYPLHFLLFTSVQSLKKLQKKKD